MTSGEVISDKKRALMAYKEKLINDIRYCTKRIEEFGLNQKRSFYEDDDSSSSDSDIDLLVPIIPGPTTHQLRAESSQLTLCLQATEELTSLQVLERDIKVLVEPPKLTKCKYPKEEGGWKELYAECKVDLVSFSIAFYIHQPHGQRSGKSYHELRVAPVKFGHATELERSVLPRLTQPSDAVQVMRNYSAACRSRRSSIARLCDKFGDSISVDASPDGGYLIKCANLLEISWSLQNVWSSIAPFHHKMKFDLEYMDEHYIKAIKHSHKQLSDPTIETNERTSLLTKILNTCIEASANISSITESETDNEQPIRRTPVKRTTLENEPEIPAKRRAIDKEKEVMAPPKEVPKKVKSKHSENVDFNRQRSGLTKDNKGSLNQKEAGKTKNRNDNNERVNEKLMQKNDKERSDAKKTKTDIVTNSKNEHKNTQAKNNPEKENKNDRIQPKNNAQKLDNKDAKKRDINTEKRHESTKMTLQNNKNNNNIALNNDGNPKKTLEPSVANKRTQESANNNKDMKKQSLTEPTTKTVKEKIENNNRVSKVNNKMTNNSQPYNQVKEKKSDKDNFKKPRNIDRIVSGNAKISKPIVKSIDKESSLKSRLPTKIPLSVTSKSVPKSLLSAAGKGSRNLATISEAKPAFVNPLKISSRKNVGKSSAELATTSTGMPVRSSPRHMKKAPSTNTGRMFAF